MLAVFVRCEALKVNMAGARDHPQALRLVRTREHPARLHDGRAIVEHATRDQNRRPHLRNAVDRAQIGRADAEKRRQHQLEQRSDRRRRHGPDRTEHRNHAVFDSRADLRIDRFQHQRVDVERFGRKQRRSTAERRANRTDALARQTRPHVGDRGGRILPFAMPKVMREPVDSPCAWKSNSRTAKPSALNRRARRSIASLLACTLCSSTTAPAPGRPGTNQPRSVAPEPDMIETGSAARSAGAAPTIARAGAERNRPMAMTPATRRMAATRIVPAASLKTRRARQGFVEEDIAELEPNSFGLNRKGIPKSGAV